MASLPPSVVGRAANDPSLHHRPEATLTAQQHEINRLREELDQRRDQLASQPAIEQAKGILMHNFGLSPDEAFALLCRLSQHTNVKVHTVAERLVSAFTGRVSAQAARAAAAVIATFQDERSAE